MTYAICKPAYDKESAAYVTAIRRGGLSIDNKRIWNDRVKVERWQIRQWSNQAAAQKALDLMVSVGGFDDYSIVELPALEGES